MSLDANQDANNNELFVKAMLATGLITVGIGGAAKGIRVLKESKAKKSLIKDIKKADKAAGVNPKETIKKTMDVKKRYANGEKAKDVRNVYFNGDAEEDTVDNSTKHEENLKATEETNEDDENTKILSEKMKDWEKDKEEAAATKEETPEEETNNDNTEEEAS